MYVNVLYVHTVEGNNTTVKSFEIWLEINEVTYVFEYIAGLDPAFAAETLAVHFCAQKGMTLLGVPLHTSTNSSTTTTTTTSATDMAGAATSSEAETDSMHDSGDYTYTHEYIHTHIHTFLH